MTNPAEKRLIFQAYRRLGAGPSMANPFPNVSSGAAAIELLGAMDRPVAGTDAWGTTLHGDFDDPEAGYLVRSKRLGVIPTDQPRFSDDPVSEINFAAPPGSAARYSLPDEVKSFSVTRQISPYGQHSFGVNANARTGDVKELFSFGQGPDGRLARKPAGTSTYQDDLAAFTRRNDPSSPWHPQIVEVPSSPEAFRTAGDAVAQLLTEDRTNYAFWPLEPFRHGNSNSAHSAQVNRAIRSRRAPGPAMRPPITTRFGAGPAPGWDHRIDGRGNIPERDWRLRWRW